MFNKKNNKFSKSLICAINGIYYGIKKERNIRFHISATVMVFYFSRFYEFSKVQLAILSITCFSVISLELINTAIEAVVDKISPEYSTLAKIAKDTAAGAVLVASIFSLFIAYLLFWDLSAINRIFIYLTNSISDFAVLILLVLILILFITMYKNEDEV